MLKRIHESHLGIEKSKRRARDILHWPNMNGQISDLIANCSSCLKHRKSNVKEPLIQHEVPDRPWQKIACDLFTLGGKDYLLTVDYYSKWVEIGFLRDSTVSSEVITQLKSTFARYGIPDEVVSDNGPQFSSRKFKQFAESWEFKHTTTSPKHPQANAHTPRSVIVTSNGTLYRRNRRDIIKTPDVIRTRSGQTVCPPRLNDFVYY